MKQLIIRSGEIEVRAELYDTHTAEKLLDILPHTGKASVWGDEIYFIVPLQLPAERDARREVEEDERSRDGDREAGLRLRVRRRCLQPGRPERRREVGQGRARR